MEMMTQLPFPKTHASTGDSGKSRKAPKDDHPGTEVVSFPTMLENNAKALASNGSSKISDEGLEQDKTPSVKEIAGTAVITETMETTESKGLAAIVAAINSEVSLETISEKDLMNTDAKLSSSDVQIEEIKSKETVQEIPGLVTGKTPSEEQIVSVKPTVASAEIITEGKEQASTAGPAKISVEVKAAEITKAVETVNVLPKINEPKVPIPGTATTASDEIKNTVVKTDTQSGEIPVTSALVDDSQGMPKVDAGEVAQKAQNTMTGAESMKMEIVKDASVAQPENTPAVENPVIARQSSAELDLLAAQASAQKTYQQPTVSTELAGTPQPTLADLDLDSGSFESKEQKEQSISRILSSLNETSTSSVKRSIRGQVLSRVVEHLQEEIGKEKLTIRLNPEKLGQIEILFQAEGDKLSITMSSQGRDAEQAIQEGTKELAEKISDNSVRYNLVDIKVENKGQDQQTKQESKQEEKREKQSHGEKQQNEGQPSHGDHNQETGAGEWAAFHLGG